MAEAAARSRAMYHGLIEKDLGVWASRPRSSLLFPANGGG